MTITTQDIQLYQPEVLDDTPNGGGRMSPNAVISGALNNLFDDQSRFDRVTGRVSLRKGWLSVNSNNRTKLLSAHAILLCRASDPRVHVSMFARNSPTDRRADAQAHLEQYLAAGATMPYYCWDTQPEGSQIVTLLTELANTSPAAGDVVVLSVERGTINLGLQQFARCIKVEESEVSATIPPAFGTKTLKQIDITIDQPLRFDLPGEVFGHTQFATQKTMIRRTTLAGGKRYYSIHQITEDIEAGDTTCQVASILTPVVPSAQQEVGIVDQQLGSDTVSLVEIGDPGADGMLTEAVLGVSITGNAAAIVTEHALIPGTVTVTLRPTGQGATHQHLLTDDGRGLLVRDGSSGVDVPINCAGTVDYRNGQIVVTGLSVATGTLDAAHSSVQYRAAVAIASVQHTAGTEVTIGNRGLVWTKTLLPRPKPGALSVAYRTFGRWITLTDRGDGTVAGSSGEGSGTINYATGAVNLTLGAEPDVGSHLLYGWGTGAHYLGPSGPVQSQVPELVITLAQAPVTPGSLSLEYEIGEDTYTITDDGAGAVTGDATGTINYQTGEVRARPVMMPAAGTTLTAGYEATGTIYTEAPAGLTFTLSHLPNPRSVEIQASYTLLDQTISIWLRDDGGGSLQALHRFGGGGVNQSLLIAGVAGTINYATGEVVLSAAPTIGSVTQFQPIGGIWSTASGQPVTHEGTVAARYRSGAGDVAEEESAPLTTLSLALAPQDLLYGLVQGSIWLEFNGRRYYDRSGQLYYRDSGGNEQAAGAINYQDGLVTLTSWLAGATTGHLRGALVAYGRWLMTQVIWRAQVDQLKPASLQLNYLRLGETVADQAISDEEGDIVGAGGLTGTVNYNTGVYQLTWADSEVWPDDASYNAVAVNFLPLDPEIIGLDPVRLPVDGRLPTISKSDIAVLHNTQQTTLPNPVIAGSTYSTRPYISALEIRDQDDLLIPTDRYTWNKTSGDITFANPLDLDDYTQPLVASHRIEDMLLVSDVQLNGSVALNSPMTHDFPAGTSYLSTALPLGNELQAAALNVFAQAAWTGVWSDALIGVAPVVAYNNTVFPIITTNRGAIRERWRLEFTSVTAYRVIGETVGEVGVGDISTVCAPINPATGAAYMTIDPDGFSGGPNVGNQIRFNTEGAARPIWFNRCTLAGPLTDPEDFFEVELRGDGN